LEVALRLYTFTNMYMSSIQIGIQSLHVVADMFTKYHERDDDREMLFTWAEDHKTVICLNGGYSDNLHKLVANHMVIGGNPYPWAAFSESQDALGGVLTSVGIILPDRIYDTISEKRENQAWWRPNDITPSLWGLRYGSTDMMFGEHQNLTSWERAFIDEVSKYGLAR